MSPFWFLNDEKVKHFYSKSWQQRNQQRTASRAQKWILWLSSPERTPETLLLAASLPSRSPHCWKVKCCFSLCEASPPPHSFPQRGRGTEQSSTMGIAMATWRTRGHQGLRSSTPRISGLVSLGRGQTPSCSQLRQLPQTHAVQLSAQRCLERVWLWTIFS